MVRCYSTSLPLVQSELHFGLVVPMRGAGFQTVDVALDVFLLEPEFRAVPRLGARSISSRYPMPTSYCSLPARIGPFLSVTSSTSASAKIFFIPVRAPRIPVCFANPMVVSPRLDTMSCNRAIAILHSVNC